ncbi:MAG: class I SAM-dependent methyltransferase, partial [Candidatus Edwardsbacteria bacterium]|nr:class I SAM-dependent methyltransferase [Candidatus Edwardsbacteria bacterium]
AGVTVLAKHSRDLLKDPAHLGTYDFVTARAVAELKDLVKDAFPFLKPGGALLAYKSAKADAEIAAAAVVIKKLGGVVESGVYPAPAAGSKDRRIVVVRKGSR